MPEQPTPTPVAPAPPPEEQKPDPLAASVAAAIAKLRRDAGLSERAAAKKLGTSQTQLRRMEDPRYLPSLRSLARVANTYSATLRVSFEAQDDKVKDKAPAPKTVPAKTGGAPKPAAAKAARGPAKAARGKPAPRAPASPARGRRAAPRRAHSSARRTPRRAAPRRKAR